MKTIQWPTAVVYIAMLLGGAALYALVPEDRAQVIGGYASLCGIVLAGMPGLRAPEQVPSDATEDDDEDDDEPTHPAGPRAIERRDSPPGDRKSGRPS